MDYRECGDYVDMHIDAGCMFEDLDSYCKHKDHADYCAYIYEDHEDPCEGCENDCDTCNYGG